MANRYVVAGGGNWNDTATWSDTSGGAGGFSIPVSTDNVFVDAASGNLVINTNSGCANFNCTGHTGTVSGSTALTVTGDTFTLSAGQTWTNTSTLTFTGANAVGDVTLTRAGKTSAQGYTFNGVGKTFKLADDHNIGTGTWTVTNGTLDSQGFDMWGALSISNSNVRTVDLGGSTFTCTNNGGVSISTVTNLTWTAPDVLIINLATSPGGIFLSAPLTFPLVRVNFTSTGGDWYGGRISDASLVVTEMQFTGTPNAASISVVLTLSTGVRIDKCAFPEGIQLVSSARGTQRTITTATNEISFDGCMVRDIVISGGPAIATNSIDLGNNSGITFQNFGPATHEIVGITKDDAGDPLPSCTVIAFKEDGGEMKEVSRTTSDGTTGAYTLPTPDNDPDYLIVATLTTPNRADAMNGIEPTVP